MSKRERLVSILKTMEHRGALAELTIVMLRRAPEAALPALIRTAKGLVRWEKRFLAAQAR